MNNSIITQNFEDKEIRVTTIDNVVYFVGKDVANALEYSSPKDAIAYHVWDEYKGAEKIPTLGGAQLMSVITQQGVYQLVLGSKKPEAKRFQKWVIEEVLPSIQKTGSYINPNKQSATPNELILMLAQSNVETEKRLDNLEAGLAKTNEDVYYKVNPRAGEGLYRYFKSNFSNITISGVATGQIGLYMGRSGYEVICSFIDEQQFGNPSVKAYELEAIEDAITNLINEEKLVMYKPIRGKIQLKWSTEYKKMKTKPTLFSSSKALLCLYPNEEIEYLVDSTR